MTAAGGRIALQLRARPLPESIVNLLSENESVIRLLQRMASGEQEADSEAATDDEAEVIAQLEKTTLEDHVADAFSRTVTADTEQREQIDAFKKKLLQAFAKEKDAASWSDVIEK